MDMNPNNRVGRVSRPPARPLLAYDVDCSFCRKWIARWRVVTRGRVEHEPYRKVSVRFPEIPLSQFQRSVQWIDRDGSVSEGAMAVVKSLSSTPGLGWLGWVYRHVPGAARFSERVYAYVAGHRQNW